MNGKFLFSSLSIDLRSIGLYSLDAPVEITFIPEFISFVIHGVALIHITQGQKMIPEAIILASIKRREDFIHVRTRENND